MHLDPNQRRGLMVLPVLAAVSVGLAWDDGWGRVVGYLVCYALVAVCFLGVFHYANRDQRRARKAAPPQT